MRRALRPFRLLLPLLALAAVAPAAYAADASAPVATTARTTRVSYLSGATVYIEAGRLDGLAVDDTVTVLRESRTIATLKVTVVSGHHASCATLASADTVRVGDTARYQARAIAVPAAGTAAADSAAAAIPGAAGDTTASRPPAAPLAAMSTAAVTTPRLRPRLSGRIGASGLFVDQEGGGGFRRPALDVRADGRDLGPGLDVMFDMRSDRVMGVGSTPSAAAVARVYRGSVAWHDAPGRWRVTAGRQNSAALTSVSLFDGALVEANGARYGGGVFAGTQPQPVTLGFSSDIFQAGVFGAMRSLAGGTRRWTLTAGGITSTASGEPNRDFLFAQAFWSDARTLVSAAQEVDVMRGWRADSASSTFSPTSTFLVARYRFSGLVSVDGGYDARRNVRLYRDRVTPETEFDDAFRQGAWGGLTLDPRHGLRVQGDVRRRFGDEADRATTVNGSVEWYDLGPWRARLRARGSDYSSERTSSRLWSFGAGADLAPTAHLELSGGSRSTEDHRFDLTDRSQWLGLDADVGLFLRWYLVGSFSRERRDTGDLTQSYLGLSWRF